MRSIRAVIVSGAALALLLVPAAVPAQINFEKTGYYLALGDSVSAGEGAVPVTHGFVYQLYDRGVFGSLQQMDFANIAIKGATADEVLALQVPQALCIQPPRIGIAPSVITVTAGANDFWVYFGSQQALPDPETLHAVAQGIATKVANIIGALVFGIPGLPAHCAQAGIPGITVLVSNYDSFGHPDPQIDAFFNFALETFSAKLQDQIALIQAQIAATQKTARVAFVDTYSAMQGRQGLLLIQRRDGFTGPFDFEIHPTNAGHSVIAAEFAKAWGAMP